MKLRDFLLPTPANDHSPHILQKMAIVGMAGLVLLSFMAVNLQSLLWQSSNWLVGAVLPATVVDLTNKERTDLTIVSLVRNPVLDEAARLKAEDMAKNHYFAHYSPKGVSPWYWFDKVSYNYAHAGENLAIHFTDSEALVEAWMKSPAHKANIVDQKFTEIGVGTAKGKFDGYETVFVVQLFGTPGVIKPVTEIPVVSTKSETNSEVAVISSAKSHTDAVIPLSDIAGVATTVEAKNELNITKSLNNADNSEILTSYISTSSDLVPVTSNVTNVTKPTKVEQLASIATKPNTLLQFVYLVLGIIVAFLLLVSIVINVRRIRPVQTIYGIALLLLMSGLFYVHLSLTSEVVIASDSQVINYYE